MRRMRTSHDAAHTVLWTARQNCATSKLSKEWNSDLLLLVSRRVRCAANMQVAQIVKRGFVFIAHAAGKIWIAQPLVACGLWHILQYAELLLNHLLALPRHLPPSRQHVVLDVILLLRSQAPPGALVFAKPLSLLWGHPVPLIELLPDT